VTTILVSLVSFLFKPTLLISTLSNVITICEPNSLRSASRVIQTVCDSLMPSVAPPAPRCESAQYYQQSKLNGETGLVRYVNECGSYNTSYMVDAKISLERIEYSDIKACILRSRCNAIPCLSSQNHLSVEQIDQLGSLAREQGNSEPCHALAPPPPAPPPPTSDPQSAKKLALTNWSNQGLNAANKARLPIAIVAPQSSYDDQLVANNLSAMLEKTLHLVDKSEAALSIEVSNVHSQIELSGRPCTDPSDEAEHIGRTSVNIRAVWMNDGRAMFRERSIPATARGCKTGEAATAARDQLLQNVRDFLSALADHN
jgi:hypothetical protein